MFFKIRNHIFKGQAESAITKMSFDRLSIYRPAFVEFHCLVFCIYDLI